MDLESDYNEEQCVQRLLPAPCQIFASKISGCSRGKCTHHQQGVPAEMDTKCT